MDPKLIRVVRDELDPGPRDAIIKAQHQTRVEEGNSVEKKTAV
jgi:hypothetical protein